MLSTIDGETVLQASAVSLVADIAVGVDLKLQGHLHRIFAPHLLIKSGVSVAFHLYVRFLN